MTLTDFRVQRLPSLEATAEAFRSRLRTAGGAARFDIGFESRLVPDSGWAYVRQVHGPNVVRARDWDDRSRPAADGLFCLPGDAMGPLAIQTADCLPVLLAHPAGACAVIHAGWRGLACGVIHECLDQLAKHGALREPDAWVAVLGPAISSSRYEVGPEVIEALGGPASRLDRAHLSFVSQPSNRAAHRYLDLREVALIQLRARGIVPESIMIADVCTFDSVLPSYRRQGAQAGRIWSWISREP